MRFTFGRAAVHGVLVLVLMLPFAASAADGGEIRNYRISISRLYESLNYERALYQLQLARQLPRDPEEEVTLSLYEGIILCEMGKQEPGASFFKEALYLRPDAKLPVQVSPKIEQLFESMRKQVKSEVGSPLAPRETQSPADKPEPAGEFTPTLPVTSPEGDKQTVSPAPLAASPGPSGPMDATSGEQAPLAERREDERPPPSPKKEEPSLLEPGDTTLQAVEPALKSDQTPDSVGATEQLMKRLLRLQEKFLRGGSLSKRVPLRELDKIGQKLQAVRTDENLKEAVRALDSWEQRHLPRSEAPLPTAEPTPGAANAERSPTELNQERYAHQEEADSIDATEQLMQKLLRLQEKFLRGESPSKRVPLRELDKIGQKIRAALTDKDLKEAARALDSWQLRHLP